MKNVLSRFFAWMKSVGGFAAYIAFAIMGTVLVLFYGSVIFHWNNVLSKNIHAASGWFHLLGWLLTLAAIRIVYSWSTRDTDKGDYIFLLAVLALSWCSFFGFNF